MADQEHRARLSPDLPAIIVAFPVDAPPFVAHSSVTDDDSRRRIIDELTPEWRDILQRAWELFARDRPDVQDGVDWFSRDEGSE